MQTGAETLNIEILKYFFYFGWKLKKTVEFYFTKMKIEIFFQFVMKI